MKPGERTLDVDVLRIRRITALDVLHNGRRDGKSSEESGEKEAHGD